MLAFGASFDPGLEHSLDYVAIHTRRLIQGLSFHWVQLFLTGVRKMIALSLWVSDQPNEQP